MEIVYLGRYNPTETLTGPEKVARRLFQHTYEKNKNVIFIDYFFKGKESNIYKRLLGKKILQSNPLIIKLGNLRIFFFLVFNQPAIIHIVTLERFIIPVYLYKFLLKGRILTTIHGILKYEISLNTKHKKSFFKDKLLESLALRYSNKLIFVSANLKEFSNKYYKTDSKKNEIIPNGIDKIFVNSKEIQFSDRLKIVLYLNSIHGQYDAGILELLTNYQKIINVPCRIYLLGDFKIEDKTLEVNIFEKIGVLDTGKLRNFLEDKQIVLKPSHYEPFSIFTAECMAMGLIPIISQNVGIRDYIKNRVNGFTYENTAEIRQILYYLYSDKDNFQKISLNAKKIINKLNWEKVAEAYYNIYKKLNEN